MEKVEEKYIQSREAKLANFGPSRQRYSAISDHSSDYSQVSISESNIDTIKARPSRSYKESHRKRLHKRSLPTEDGSENDEEIYKKARLRGRKSKGSSSKGIRPKKTQSWSEIYAETIGAGMKNIGEIWNNGRNIYYHMGFNNPHGFNLMIVGLKIGFEIVNLDAQMHFTATNLVNAVLGVPEDPPSGELTLCPDECRGGTQSRREFLKCLHRNLEKAPINMPPKHSMTKEETARAALTTKNFRGIPKLMDQSISKGGICVAVTPSLMTVGLAIPEAERKRGKTYEPFVMDLLMTIDKMPQNFAPFVDPCHISIACIPFPTIELHKQPQKQNFKSKGDAHPSTFRLWESQPIPVKSNLIISHKFCFNCEGPISLGDSRPVLPGWALVFQAGKIPKLKRACNFGYSGIDASVALILDPVNMTLSIHRNGESKAFLQKKSSSFPSDIMSGGWHRVSVQYRTHEKNLVIVIYKENLPEKQFVSVFPLEIDAILGNPQNMHVGLTCAAAVRYRVSQFVPFLSELSIQAVVPDLSKTRIYYVDRFSVVPYQVGVFLIQLRDSCDKTIPYSILGIKVQMRRIRSYPSFQREKKARKKSSLYSHRHHSSDKSVLARPETKYLRCKVKPIPELGISEVKYRAKVPGRYRVFVSFAQEKTEFWGDKVLDLKYWYQVRDYQIYVKNLW